MEGVPMFKNKLRSLVILGSILLSVFFITFSILHPNKKEVIEDNKPLNDKPKYVNEEFDPKNFGAIGDGITDDTKALQAWLNAPGKNKVLTKGVYKITSGLTSFEPGITIKSDGGSILAGKENITMITVLGNNSQVSVTLDGNNIAAGGILIEAKDCTVKNSKIGNIYGSNQAAFGVKAQTSGGILINSNTIYNIKGSANGKMGDNIGASRAILVTSKEAATQQNIVINNIITNVTGEEGDAIQFLFNNGFAPFLDAQGIIQGNTIKNPNRRAIKVQASNVKIFDNTHVNTLTINELPHAANLIDIIQSNNVVVQGNKLDATYFLGISLSGKREVKASGIVVRKNAIRGGLTLSSGNRANTSGIYWNHVQDSKIIANSISDTIVPISGSDGMNIIIQDNRFWGGDGRNPAINILSSNSQIKLFNNQQMSGKRLTLVRNHASP